MRGDRKIIRHTHTHTHTHAMRSTVQVQVHVAFPIFLFIEKSFHVITQLGVWCRWWFNYPGPLLEVELESACLSGQGCGLCIALIRPNHWAASVAQWLEHLSSKQCVVGSNPTRAALFFSLEKKELFGLVAFPFFLFIEKFSCGCPQ